MEVHGYLGTSEEALNQVGKEGGKVTKIKGSPWIKDSEMKACLAFHMAGHGCQNAQTWPQPWGLKGQMGKQVTTR